MHVQRQGAFNNMRFYFKICTRLNDVHDFINNCVLANILEILFQD